MREVLKEEVDNLVLEVETDDWLQALSELDIARRKIELVRSAKLKWPFNQAQKLSFTKESVTRSDWFVLFFSLILMEVQKKN